MSCICAIPLGNGFFVEHEIRCPLYDPPLTQAEIRVVRRVIALHELAERNLASTGDLGKVSDFSGPDQA